jgi:hypothetical protein
LRIALPTITQFSHRVNFHAYPYKYPIHGIVQTAIAPILILAEIESSISRKVRYIMARLIDFCRGHANFVQGFIF